MTSVNMVVAKVVVAWAALVAVMGGSVCVFLAWYTMKMEPHKLTTQSKTVRYGARIGRWLVLACALATLYAIGEAVFF